MDEEAWLLAELVIVNENVALFSKMGRGFVPN